MSAVLTSLLNEFLPHCHWIFPFSMQRCCFLSRCEINTSQSHCALFHLAVKVLTRVSVSLSLRSLHSLLNPTLHGPLAHILPKLSTGPSHLHAALPHGHFSICLWPVTWKLGDSSFYRLPGFLHTLPLASLLSPVWSFCCFLPVWHLKWCSVSKFGSCTISVFLLTSLSWWSQLVCGLEISSIHIWMIPKCVLPPCPPWKARLRETLWLQMRSHPCH